MTSILEFIEQRSARNGARDRAIFVLRQKFKIRDLVDLSVLDVLNISGQVKSFVQTTGGQINISTEDMNEIGNYLKHRYGVQCLGDIPIQKYASKLFTTQKMPAYSLNTMAQNLCLTQAAIRNQFTEPKEPAKPVQELYKLLQDEIHSDIAASTKKSLMERFSRLSFA